MWWRAFKYILIGAIFTLITTLMLLASSGFIERSEPVQLIVLQMERKTDDEGAILYRPVFALDTNERPRPEYRGNSWISFLVHKAGDVVPGRYDAKTGQMNSDRMLTITRWVWRIVQVIGILTMVEGVLMLFGIPEHRMPIRLGRRR